MSDYRIEIDSLGEVRVPTAAKWGAQTQRAIDNFPITGLKPMPAFIWSMVLIKRAAAEVNRDLGLFEERHGVSGARIADAIIELSDEVLAGKYWEQWVVDPIQAGAGTSHNMNTNEVLANLANERLGFAVTDKQKPVNPNDHVNMAQSTNDTIPTAIRLGALWQLEPMLDALSELAAALRAKAEEFDPIVKSGRTHLQDAVPVRMGQEFGAYAKSVERHVARLRVAAEGLRRLGIGGTATGSGLNAHDEYHSRMVAKLAELSGLTLYESDDLFESMQSMADAVHFSGAMRTLAQDLTRIANDFRLLASGPSTGLDELRLPAVQPGSSIMPGKVNPVMAEMLNMAMYQVIGNDLTVMLGGQAGQLELNVMMPVIAHNIFMNMQIITNATTAFTDKCVRGLGANAEKATGWLARNAILVTALNPIIGYLKGAEVAKEALKSNRTVREVVVEKGYLSGEEVDRLLDARQLTYGGIHK